MISLSAPAVKRRVDRLRAGGAIGWFTVRLEPEALGWTVEGYVELYCGNSTSPQAIRTAIARFPEIVDASTISGEADALLMGRVTYDGMSAAWPARGDDPTTGGAYFNSVRKYVASRTLTDPEWNNTEVLQGDLISAVRALKAQDGADILQYGYGSVTAQLVAAGLVDELRLLVHPVAARKGRKLFDDGEAPYHLRVTATEVYPTGVIRVIYAPTDGPAKAGYDDVKDQVPEG